MVSRKIAALVLGLLAPVIAFAGAVLPIPLPPSMGGSGSTIGGAGKVWRYVAVFGDSKQRINCGGSSASRNAYYSYRGNMTWVLIQTGFQLGFSCGYDSGNANTGLGANGGLGGETAVQGAARISGWLSTLSPQPDAVTTDEGTNDVRGACTSQATCDATYTAVTTALDQQWTAIANRGMIPVALAISARNATGGANNWTATERQLVARINDWEAKYEKSNKNSMIWVDINSWIVDPTTGDAITGLLVDGLHEAQLAAYYEGRAIQDKLGIFLPRASFHALNPYDTYDATYNPFGNLIPNGQVAGTSGTATSPCTGTVTTSWTCERNSGTVSTAAATIVSKVIGASSWPLQQIVATSPGGGALTTTESIRFRTTSTTITTGVSSGACYVGRMYYEVDAPTVSGLNLGVYVQLQDISTSGASMRCGTNDSTTTVAYPSPDAAFSGYCETPKTLTTGTTGLKYQIIVNLDGTKVGSLTSRFGEMEMRPVTCDPWMSSYPTGP